MKTLLKKHLRVVVPEADFRCTDSGLWANFIKKKTNRDIVRDLKSDEVIMFIAKKMDQVFFSKDLRGTGKPDFKSERVPIFSVRFRIPNGILSADMIANYANEVGFELVGLENLAQVMEGQRERRRQHERDLRMAHGIKTGDFGGPKIQELTAKAKKSGKPHLKAVS